MRKWLYTGDDGLIKIRKTVDMNFLIEKNELVTVLSKLQGLTGKSSNLAITENVLIEACDDSIVIKATDLETGFEGCYPAKIEKAGSIAVNARKLYEISKQFPNSDIFVEEIKNKRIRISNGNIRFDILGNSPDHFPEITSTSGTIFFKIKAQIFRDMIKRTTIISSTAGEKRAHINGVLLEICDQNDVSVLRMVSTDANRLSVVNCKLEKKYEIKKTSCILIPKKSLNEVVKFIDTDIFLNIGVRDNVLILKKERETIIVRLLEGEFPEYGKIISKKGGSIIGLSKYDFAKTLKRMSILTNEKHNSVLFIFGNNKMVVITKNAEYGESKEEVEIDFSEGTIEVAFNPKFLMDTLSVMEGESVFINIVDGNEPCIIEGLDEGSFISVIMPMRI